MTIAKFECSSELLRQLLHLPTDAAIVDVRRGGLRGDGFDVELTVKSPEFADVPDGDPIPVRTPWFRRVDEKVEFERWT